jgi:ketosteroid isomerase-like protein
VPEESNVDLMRRGYEDFLATGDLSDERLDPEFVWDMSTFRNWPERQTYEGIEGAREFLADWLGAWEDWELSVEELHDAGDKVVAAVRQRGTAKATGMPVGMHFGQVWTYRDGKQLRMEMYATP